METKLTAEEYMEIARDVLLMVAANMEVMLVLLDLDQIEDVKTGLRRHVSAIRSVEDMLKGNAE